jgi:hypothetical protein
MGVHRFASVHKGDLEIPGLFSVWQVRIMVGGYGNTVLPTNIKTEEVQECVPPEL